MIKEIKTPEGIQTMLLGYEAIRFLTKPLKEDQDFMDQLEKAALIGFNTWNKRNNKPEINQETLIGWFDDMDVYTEVIKAVKVFSENFSQRVSEDQTSEGKKAKK
jgi:hypothetical protein